MAIGLLNNGQRHERNGRNVFATGAVASPLRPLRP